MEFSVRKGWLTRETHTKVFWCTLLDLGEGPDKLVNLQRIHQGSFRRALLICGTKANGWGERRWPRRQRWLVQVGPGPVSSLLSTSLGMCPCFSSWCKDENSFQMSNTLGQLSSSCVCSFPKQPSASNQAAKTNKQTNTNMLRGTVFLASFSHIRVAMSCVSPDINIS